MERMTLRMESAGDHAVLRMSVGRKAGQLKVRYNPRRYAHTEADTALCVDIHVVLSSSRDSARTSEDALAHCRRVSQR